MNDQVVDITLSELRKITERIPSTVGPDTQLRIVADERSIKIILPEQQADPDQGQLLSWTNRI